MNPKKRKLQNPEDGEALPMEEWQLEKARLEQLVAEKNAELAQKNRELEIESALERVRTKSMAMNKSEELRAIATTMYNQMINLGFKNISSGGFVFPNEVANLQKCWGSSIENRVLDVFDIPYTGDPILQERIEARQQGIPFLEQVLTGDKLKKHLDFVSPKKSRNIKGQAVVDWMPKLTIFNIAFFKHGYINLLSTEKLNTVQQAILIRFANVFEQTYTRFLDLQKAEAQTKEAQIEAALERVRSRTMAMHKSEELSTVAAAMFKEFHQLKLINEIARTVININDEENGDCQMWLTQIGGAEISTHFQYNYLEHELWETEYRAYQKIEKNKRKEHKYIVVHEGKAFEELIAFGIAEKIVTPEDLKIIKEVGMQKWIEHIVWFAYGSLVIARESPLSEDEFNILQRFAKVFEQTYTRFLDLQKAEAQAREAQIEAALERVRAASMSMHKSREISQVAATMMTQFNELGIPMLRRCKMYTIDEENGQIKCWYSTKSGSMFSNNFSMPVHGDEVIEQIFDSWKNRQSTAIEVVGETYKKYVRFMKKYGWKYPKGEKTAKRIVLNEFPFDNGLVEITAYEVLPAKDQQIGWRFARVFEQAFTRFFDLQKAEKQAQEIEKVFNENQRLLHSILPKQIAEQIRAGQQTIVKKFEQVSILFADIVGFTKLSEKISPQEVVDMLNGLFSKFDDLTDKYHLEKIKTIGDAYMVAAGVPEEKNNHAQLIFAFAKEMLQTLQDFNQVIGTDLKIRIGISSGPVVAGVIGKKKFTYDLWGDTVNTAARMEANGQADCIQVSPITYEILEKEVVFEKIPNIEIKGKGAMDVYLWRTE